jgi:hypothetical protein
VRGALLLVVNDALALCGEPALAALEERSSRAAIIVPRLDPARDALLRLHDWQFASGNAAIALVNGQSAGPLKLRFALPEDCVKVRAVNDLAADEWQLEAASVDGQDAPGLVQLLVTNHPAPVISYTRRIEHPDLWDALFREAMALKLAIAAGPGFGRGADWVDAKEGQLRRILLPAARRSAQERAARERPVNGTFIESRKW